MPTGASDPPLLLDTSAAVAFCVAGHEHHEQVFALLAEQELGLAGNAAFETYSVLTRLPTPARLSPPAAGRLLATNFPHTRHLDEQRAADLAGSLPRLGITGGSVYDALVGATALQHDLLLVSRDRRAASTYRKIGARLRLL